MMKNVELYNFLVDSVVLQGRACFFCEKNMFDLKATRRAVHSSCLQTELEHPSNLFCEKQR